MEAVDAPDAVLPAMRARAAVGPAVRDRHSRCPGTRHGWARARAGDQGRAPPCPDPPACSSSSAAVRGQAGEARAAGFDAFLTKPVRQSPLCDCLATLLGAPTAAAPGTPIVTRHTLAEARSARRFRILLAEDHEINQKLAVAVLEGFGYRVEVVGTGAQAVAAVTPGRLRPGADGLPDAGAGRVRGHAPRSAGATDSAGPFRSSP